jgi:DNA-binding Lrp family transcriptional regulator
LSKKLDKTELNIVHNLQQDGRTSITDLAKKSGASRPTVTKKLKRLRDSELILIKGGLNLSKLDFKIACVGMEVINDESRKDVEQYLRDCPRVLNLFRTPEKANIHVNVWGEDDHTINSTIESFRDFPNAEIIYTHYLGTPIYGDMIINVEPGEKSESPCGKICPSCHRYNNDWCLGCPTTTFYKNPMV